MASGGWIFLVLLVLLLIAGAGWLFFTRRRAHLQGLPPPPLSSYIPFANHNRSSQNYTRQAGVVGWAKSKLQSLKGSGGSGAYETPAGAGQRRGLDPDGAWDARVGDEADLHGAGGYYEEQELGLHPPASGGSYAGGGYGPTHNQALPDYGADEPERGRRRSRDDAFIGGGQKGLDQRYDEEMSRQNPFGDAAERSSMRGVSPRPADLRSTTRSHKDTVGGHGDSPTERRSMFHENV